MQATCQLIPTLAPLYTFVVSLPMICVQLVPPVCLQIVSHIFVLISVPSQHV